MVDYPLPAPFRRAQTEGKQMTKPNGQYIIEVRAEGDGARIWRVK